MSLWELLCSLFSDDWFSDLFAVILLELVILVDWVSRTICGLWLVFWSFEPFYAVMLPIFCQNLQLLFASLCHWLVAHYLATFALEWEICGISSIHFSTESSELGSLLTILLETVVCSRVGEYLDLEHYKFAYSLASFVYAIGGVFATCVMYAFEAF